MKKRIISLLIVACLMFGTCSTALAVTIEDVNGDNVINYVSLGASNVNGYGMRGYLPDGVYDAPWTKESANIYGYQQTVEGSYPDLIADYLEANGLNVVRNELAISSMRAEEVRFLLDDNYAGDKYTDWRFIDVPGYDRNSENWFVGAGRLELGDAGAAPEVAVTALRTAYREYIENADLITVDIGINNFGVYASNQIVSNMYENDLFAIAPEYVERYEEGKAYVMEQLAQYAGDAFEMLPTETMDHIADTMAYALVGFCTSFDIVMEKIYELNPDAVVVVVSIQNLMEGLYAEIPGVGTIPFGELFGAVINAANAYTATGSPYSDRYFYSDVRKAGRVEFFMDEILAYNGNPETLGQDMMDCFDVYDDDLLIKTRVQKFLYERLTQQSISDNDFVVGLATGNINIETLLTTYPQYRPLYEKALATAYDVIAEIMQAGIAVDTLDATSFGTSFGPIEDGLLDAIFGTLETAVVAAVSDSNYSFSLEEVYPNGFFETTAVNANMSEGLVKTVATMGIRTGIGNSFFGHPNGNGHIEIANAILETLANDTKGSEIIADESHLALTQFYNFLAYDTSYTIPEKVDLLEKLYSVVNGTGVLSDYPEVALIEKVYRALSDNGLIGDKETMAIILYVYADLLDDGNVDILDIIEYIYFDVLAIPQARMFMMRARPAEVTMTPAIKLEVIETVYGVLKDNLDLTAYPQLDVVEDLYEDLMDEELITDEQALAIFDTVFETLVENEEIGDIGADDVEKIATEIVEGLINNPDIPTENKLAIVEKVSNAMADSGMVGADVVVPVIPAMPFIRELQLALKNAGYLTDAQATDIINHVYELFTSGTAISDDQLIALAKYVYNVVGADLTASEKLNVVVIVYEVADKYGYIDYAASEAYKYAYQYAVDNGYISDVSAALGNVASEIAGVDVDALDIPEELKDELKAAAALVVEDIAAIDALLTGEFATLDGLFTGAPALLNKLSNDIGTLKTLAESAGTDAYDLAVANYEAAKTAFRNDFRNTMKKVDEYLYNTLTNAYPHVLETIKAEILSIAAKFGPEAEEAVRKVMEDPMAVHAAIMEYGNNIDAIIKKWYPYAELIAGPAWGEYGDEITEAVTTTVQEQVDALVDVLKSFTSDADAFIADYIANLQIVENFTAIADALVTNGTDLATETLDELTAIVEQLEKDLAEDADAVVEALEALYVGADSETAKTEINDAIAAIRATEAERIAALYEIKADIEDAYAAVEAAAAGVTDIYTAIDALEVIINGNYDFNDTIDALSFLKDELFDAAGDVYEAAKVLVTLTADIETAAEKINDAALSANEKIMDALEAADAVIEPAAGEAYELLETAYEAAEVYVTNTLDKVDADIANLYNYCKTELYNAVIEMNDAVETALVNAVTGEYVIDCESKYYAIGSDKYADDFAAMGIPAAGEIADADIITIDLGTGTFADMVGSQIDGIVAETVKDAVDALIADGTFGQLNPAKIKEVIFEQIGETIDLNATVAPIDWSSVYVDERGAGVIKETLDNVMIVLVDLGLPQTMDIDITELTKEYINGEVYVTIDVVSIVRELLENAVYAYVANVEEIGASIIDLREVTDAEIVVFGAEVPAIEGLDIALEGTNLTVNDMIAYAIDFVNAHYYAYALANNENTTYAAADANFHDVITVVGTTDHVYELVSDTATCEVDGVKTYTCSVCGDTYTVASPATSHAWGAWVSVDADTHQRTCANDASHVETEAHADANSDNACDKCGHDMTPAPIDPPPYYPPYIPEEPEWTWDCDGTGCEGSEFADLTELFAANPDLWYHEAVDYVVAKGLMNGVENNQFAPQIAATRAMLITTLYRIAGCPAVTGEVTYNDVLDNAWYTDAIIWGTQNGIVNGVEGNNFAPNKAMTREQAAVMFYRFAKYMGVSVSASTDLTTYVDDHKVSFWAEDALEWANAVQLIRGREGNQLVPLGNTKRCELAVLLFRWCEEIA